MGDQNKARFPSVGPSLDSSLAARMVAPSSQMCSRLGCQTLSIDLDRKPPIIGEFPDGSRVGGDSAQRFN
jgi:hypothetical protein